MLGDLSHVELNKKSNIFNCGYGKGYSVKDILDSANSLLKNNINYDVRRELIIDDKVNTIHDNSEKFDIKTEESSLEDIFLDIINEKMKSEFKFN